MKINMKIIKLLLLLLVTTLQLSADYSNTATRIYIETKDGFELDKLRFGINKNATNSLDTALGELELPPFPPPEGIHAGFDFLDTNQGENIISYLDLRPFPENEYDTVKFVLQTFKGAGDKLTLWWHPIGPEIQSAFIVDKITEGTLIRINMKDSSKAEIDNEFIERFLFLIIYNPNTSVEEDESNDVIDNELNVFPLEFTDRVTISCDISFSRYELYNLYGSLAAKGMIMNGHADIALNAAAPGIYFIAVYDSTGRRIVKKIIKV